MIDKTELNGDQWWEAVDKPYKVNGSIQYSRKEENSIDFNNSSGILGFYKRKDSLTPTAQLQLLQASL